ncbi:MAG: IS110 family transposase [Gammaproteobacteria bacterium]|nr:IS110 family transposase [Gammaproteobacteria bacterium]MDH3467782.1 IS110 family transposase [Gammaproteobacteria bacterium]
MNTLGNNSFTAFVGIDWADATHDVCIQGGGDEHREFARISHQVDAIDTWAQSLYRRFGGPIAVALELSKGPVVYALQKYDFVVIFPVNPTTLAKYREAFTPSGAKDDPTDAELALDLILRHPDRFKPLAPQSVEMRTLVSLVEQRRRLVNDRVRITNRLRNTLKQYYPQALQWFDRIDTPLFCDFIERWPTVIQVKRARRTTLATFFNKHNMRFVSVLETRLQSIKTTTPLTLDDAVITPHRLQALVLVDLLRATLVAIKRFDAAIADLAPKHADYALFDGLPGAGPSLAPRLLVAFGEQRERFSNAAELQQYAGVAPVTERSGNKHWVHWRWQCPTFLRQTFVEWSAQTINKSFWAGVYYQQQRDKGCSHQAAVRALAFKWIRILYRCWQSRTPYNETVYLKALQRKGAPLLKQADATVLT